MDRKCFFGDGTMGLHSIAVHEVMPVYAIYAVTRSTRIQDNDRTVFLSIVRGGFQASTKTSMFGWLW